MSITPQLLGMGIGILNIISTSNGTSDHTLGIFCRSYFMGGITNVELQVYNVMCC
jgi:hypothetical protein